jgi:Tol biopolymer transport system component
VPKFSPDGTRILFAHGGTLYVVPVVGGEPAELFAVPEGAQALYPDWSPDGTQVVFAWYEYGWDHNELRVANLDGSGMQTLWVGGPSETAELPDWGQ